MRQALFTLGLVVGLTVPALAEDPARAVATVNGEAITLGDVEESRHLLPPQLQALPLESVYGLLVNSLIDRRLAAVKARSEGLDQDPAYRKQMARVEEQLLQRNYFTKAIEARTTEAALRAAYDDLVKDESRRTEVKARHIVVGTEAEAKAVLAALKDGADFAKLAREKMDGESGDLGYFRYEQMPPEIAEIAFKLKPGQAGPAPVRSQLGWHVIRVDDRRIGAPPSFEDAQGRLRADLARKIGGEIAKELRRDAKVERFKLDGSPWTGDDAKDGNK